MNYIIDTHILIWFVEGNTNLSQQTLITLTLNLMALKRNYKLYVFSYLCLVN